MNEPISGALVRLTTEGGRVIQLLRAQARLLMTGTLAQRLRWAQARIGRSGGSEQANKPITGALVKLSAESSKVILALPERGRALVKRVPRAGAGRTQEAFRAQRPCLPRDLRRHSRRGTGRHRARLRAARVAGRFPWRASCRRSRRRSTASFPICMSRSTTPSCNARPTDRASCSACATSGFSTRTAPSSRRRRSPPSA